MAFERSAYFQPRIESCFLTSAIKSLYMLLTSNVTICNL
nr:MAG TPA: hypothetical protein [Caudoviricetes sp.]